MFDLPAVGFDTAPVIEALGRIGSRSGLTYRAARR